MSHFFLRLGDKFVDEGIGFAHALTANFLLARGAALLLGGKHGGVVGHGVENHLVEHGKFLLVVVAEAVEE